MAEATTAVAQVPAHILARIAARGGAKSALLDAVVSGISYPRISIRASRFRLVDDGVETVVGTELDVIFVAVNPRVSKIWYDKAFSSDTDDKSPPACWSDDGVKPDANVASPVNADCATCPKNVLGSRITPSGRQSKECNDIRHVAVVPAADSTKVYGLTIPVSGMKAFRKYFKELSQYGLNPEEVVTTLGFDDEASFPKLIFSQKGYVPEKHLKTVEEFGRASETLQIIRIASVPALAAPRAVATPSKPVEQAKPALTRPEKEVVTDEEVPVKAAVARPPAAKKQAKPKDADPAEDPVSALEKQLDDLFA